MKELYPFQVTVIGPQGRKTWFCFAASWKQAHDHAVSQFGMTALCIVKRCRHE